jgi:hypothetical protein
MDIEDRNGARSNGSMKKMKTNEESSHEEEKTTHDGKAKKDDREKSQEQWKLNRQRRVEDTKKNPEKYNFICNFWDQNGFCRYGDDCIFKHDKDAPQRGGNK